MLSALYVTPLAISDHDGVKFTIVQGGFNRKFGLWKFNNKLLSDKTFVPKMREWLTYEIQQINNVEWPQWSCLKAKIKQFVVKYSKDVARYKRLKKDVITKDIISLKKLLANGEKVVASINRLEGQLKTMFEAELESEIIKSRAIWIEEGEKPTKYFFSLNHANVKRNTIDCLVDENDNRCSEQKDKLRIITSFYTNLYCLEDTDVVAQNSLLLNMSACLSDENSLNCEGLLPDNELVTAMGSMNSGKSPGEDGLTLEFFKQFSDLLVPILKVVANESFLRGTFPSDMVRSIIRLAFKKGDKADLRNWRPISLLNTDYKIISRALGGRLKSVLSEVVYSDQTCGVPGRTIFQNLNLLRDCLSEMENSNQCGILLSLDQEKAFDRVDRGFLDRVLEKFGFGESFRKWISVLYFNATAN